jgi:phospholipid-binding lipoprotein MlaA
MRHAVARCATTALVLALAACATPHPGSMKVAEADPWEKTNRKIYAFNKRSDKYLLHPIAAGYNTVVPTAARRGISNGYNNYLEPLSFFNALFQGKVKEAFQTADRFLINSTLGVGGLADQATDMGLPEQKEDFGQTFAYWGIPSGPYMMIPIFGPRTLLDFAGLGGDIVLDPSDLTRNALSAIGPWWTIGIFGAKATITRAELIDAGADGLLNDSLDEYATVRSAYLQRRRNQIWDGNPPDDEDAPVEDAPLAPGAVRQPAAPQTAAPTPQDPPK